MPDEGEARQYPVQWGYGNDFIEINDSPSRNPPQVIEIPIGAFDDIVRDYIKNRREKFAAQGLVDGAIFDDDNDLWF